MKVVFVVSALFVCVAARIPFWDSVIKTQEVKEGSSGLDYSQF